MCFNIIDWRIFNKVINHSVLIKNKFWLLFDNLPQSMNNLYIYNILKSNNYMTYFLNIKRITNLLFSHVIN